MSFSEKVDIHALTTLLASGNFGTPITKAIIAAGFNLTIITRAESKATFPDGVTVVRTDYTLDHLRKALVGQDAAVCVVGPGGISLQSTMIDAAAAAGVKRFIINDFGWGPNVRGLPEFKEIQLQRRTEWDHAKTIADSEPGFTFTGISTGNPIDWALKRFPTMGFNITNQSATIYDDGTEEFTGTTLEGIGQSVVGVLQHPKETENRFVKVLSIKTCQNELLAAFQGATGSEWEIQRSSTESLLKSGRRKLQEGSGGWMLDLAVAQLFDKGEARCVVAPSREESDSELLGVVRETADGIVAKVLKL